MSSNKDLRYAASEVHDEDIEYYRVTLSYLEERVKSLGYMHFKDIYYKDPYVEKFGEVVKVINSKQELIHMRYLLNERGIIDVYVEHVCDELDILDLLEGGTILQEPVDEGTMDIGEGCATQNSQPTPNFHEAPQTATEGDANETDAMHGGDVAQQEDLQNNDHDDEELPDIVHNDADDEDSGEGCMTQNSQPAPNFHEVPETTTKGDADQTDVVHGGDAAQQQDQENNDHDDEDLLDIVPSDADDEEMLESIRNKRNIKPVQVQEKMQMVLDQAAQSMTPLPQLMKRVKGFL
ncbi:hypothetical protein SLE2022_212190 [Rubroshorea leprosula]